MTTKPNHKMEFPDGALAALMQEFRNYRHELDMIKVDSGDYKPPEEGGGRVE